MCRLFGFRSTFSSGVHHSLISAENALLKQSGFHPDGWGVAHYIGEVPHIIKSPTSAIDDNLFKRVSGLVSSQTVLAHLRKATQGNLTAINCHPFQFGHWSFIHNGNIKNFESHRQDLINLVEPKLRRYILGSTDSEIIFYIILSFISKVNPLYTARQNDFKEILISVKEAIKSIVEISGELSLPKKPGENSENYLSFLITNGSVMIGFHGGQSLNYTTYKKKCPDRELCAYYNQSCENPTQGGKQVNHLIFASEKLAGENIWSPMKLGDFIGIDSNMILHQCHLDKQ